MQRRSFLKSAAVAAAASVPFSALVEEFLHGLTEDGETFQFCQNTVVLNGERNGIVGNFAGSEFAGACYSPNGRWLFASIQSPGITFAITGPWRRGAL